MSIKTGRNAEKVTLTWQRAGQSNVHIAGGDSTWVFGIERELHRYLLSGRYSEDPPQALTRRRFKSWVKAILIAALGGLLATALAGLARQALGLFGGWTA